MEEGNLVTTSRNDTYGKGVVLDVGHYWVKVYFFGREDSMLDEEVQIPKHQLVILN